MKILYIVKNNEFQKNQIVFLYEDLDEGISESVIRTYFPDIDEKLKELKNYNPKKHLSLEYVLKTTIEDFIEYSKYSGSTLKIVFENNDAYLSYFLKMNFSSYLLTTKNLFGDIVKGVTFTKKVKDYFNSEKDLELYKTVLTLRDYINEKNSGL